MYSSEEPHQQHNHQHRLQHGQRVDDHDECLIELTVGARYGVKPANGGCARFRWGNNVQRPASETRGVGGDPLVRMEVGKCLLHLLVELHLHLLHLLVERLLFTLVFLSQ